MSNAAPAGDDFVKLVEASDNAQASIIRSYLEHAGITVYVQGENHRSMLGMVGAYIALNILVPERDHEQACALMEEFESAEEDTPAAEMRGVFRDEFDDDDDDDDAWLESAGLQRRVRVARLAALVFPIGGGHFSAGAPLSGVVLAAIVVGGIWGAIASEPALALLVPMAIVMDYFGVRGIVERKARSESRRGTRDAASRRGGR